MAKLKEAGYKAKILTPEQLIKSIQTKELSDPKLLSTKAEVIINIFDLLEKEFDINDFNKKYEVQQDVSVFTLRQINHLSGLLSSELEASNWEVTITYSNNKDINDAVNTTMIVKVQPKVVTSIVKGYLEDKKEQEKNESLNITNIEEVATITAPNPGIMLNNSVQEIPLSQVKEVISLKNDEVITIEDPILSGLKQDNSIVEQIPASTFS